MKTIAVLIWLKVIVMILAVLVVLYLLMIMPRLTNRRERKKFLNVYYAHRGLHDNETDAPENSMSAFCRAVEAGYGIELDVQVTKDKIPVVSMILRYRGSADRKVRYVTIPTKSCRSSVYVRAAKRFLCLKMF